MGNQQKESGSNPELSTNKLSKKSTVDLSILEPEVTYRPVPHKAPVDEDKPVWRVRFDLASDPSRCFGLDINDEVKLGRGISGADFVDLSEFDAEALGVSRVHLALRPTGTKLHVVDLGSTNGTWRNGRSIGVNTPYYLVNGDSLTLGRLEFTVRIIDRPRGQTALLQRKADLGEALSQMAKTITSQLELDQVLDQVLETTIGLVSANEASIWLVDEQSGELYLEASLGIKDEDIKRLRMPVSTDTPAGKAVKTGKSQRAAREPEGDKLKVKTGYLVESLLFVPMTLGGVTFGVLAAVHQETGKSFSSRDERLLAAIGDFAAIAVQNARTYRAADKALEERIEELAVLNELAHAVTSSLNLGQVHDVLMEQIHKHWDIESASLWLVDARSNILTHFPDDGKTAYPIPIGEGIIGEVAKTGRPQISTDLMVLKKAAFDDDTVKFKAHSVLCVPLTIRDRSVGVLALFNKHTGEFNDDDITRLQAFSSPVATAIVNARLFAQSERERATVLATANALSQPLIILNQQGELIISNEAAKGVLDTSLSAVLDGASEGVGRTTEVEVGEKTYLTSVEHSPRVGTIIVMQDITYVKQLEHAQAEFVNALSHDLKSPLTSIKGWAQLIGRIPPADERLKAFPSRIIEATDRTLGMISQLLDIALLTEAPQANRLPCDLTEIVKQAVSDLGGAALAKSIDMKVDQTGEPYPILADRMRLYRSVMNLVDNAIKYSPEGTGVRVTLAFNDDQVVFKVCDGGEGIPEEDLPHIFDKYYRGEQSRRGPEGVGLGLVLVKAMAEAHGGHVNVRNLEGCGAEFTFMLPASLRVR